MAHQADNSVIETVVQLLSENGLPHMADAVRLMLNEAMRIERSQALEADPYQRTEKRHGYANGFKPKTLNTRVGELALQVPQVRGEVEVCPSALERGVRSERALKCAIAEMYVQGVSTRKVTAVMSELCGLEVSSISPPHRSVAPVAKIPMMETENATGPVNEAAISRRGDSHGIAPVVPACKVAAAAKAKASL